MRSLVKGNDPPAATHFPTQSCVSLPDAHAKSPLNGKIFPRAGIHHLFRISSFLANGQHYSENEEVRDGTGGTRAARSRDEVGEDKVGQIQILYAKLRAPHN